MFIPEYVKDQSMIVLSGNRLTWSAKTGQPWRRHNKTGCSKKCVMS